MRLGSRTGPVEERSALNCVVQVQHAVALDHLVGIIEEDGAGMAAEETHSFAQNNRGDVHRDLVDEPCRERLSAHIAGGHADETVAGELLWPGRCLPRPNRQVWNGASAWSEIHVSGSGRWVTTTSSSPAAGAPSQPLVVSNR